MNIYFLSVLFSKNYCFFIVIFMNSNMNIIIQLN